MNRLRIAAETRKLAKAETELGLLGWQQVDFAPETQREVDKIQNYEREQSRLTNESAGLASTLRELQQRRALERRQFEEARRQLQAERRAVLEPAARLQKQLGLYRRQEPHYEKRIPDLDRELRQVERMYSELLAVAYHTPSMRDEIVRLRERTVAIPNEKADLRTQHMRDATEIKSLEASLSRIQESGALLEKQLREIEENFAGTDRELATEIKNLERAKARVDKEIDSLEVAKVNPYQQIGRVLADNDLAPMNQPNALEKVRRHRASIEHLESTIAMSEAVCAELNAEVLRVSYFLIGGMVIVLLLVFSVLLSLRA